MTRFSTILKSSAARQPLLHMAPSMQRGKCLFLASQFRFSAPMLDEGGRVMRRQLAFLVLCSGVTVLSSGCATKSFVQTQLGATESKLNQRADTQETKLREQETKLRETADRAGAS